MIYRYLYIFFITYQLISCASEVPPTGGPDDLEPPKIVSTFPDEKNQTNFIGNVVEFTFDEHIDANSLKKNTIITPDPGDYKYQIRKKTLSIIFEEKLKANTTYKIILNEAIQDVTRKNKIGTYQLAFSTGEYLDSLSINGRVKLLMTQGNVEGALVAIYENKDTLDIRNDKPLYYVKTSKDGEYKIDYLKEGTYKVYAFIDKNNSLTYNPKSEPIGYLSNNIQLIKKRDSINFNLVLQDTVPTKLLFTKAEGNIHLLKFNKGVKGLLLSPSFDNTVSEDGKTVHVFSKLREDSLMLAINYSDSLNNTFHETATLKKDIKEEKITLIESIKIINEVRSSDDTLRIQLTTKEPIEKINKTAIDISLDSLILNLEQFNIYSNKTKTKHTFYKKINHLYDTVSITLKDSALLSSYSTRNTLRKEQKELKDITEYGIISGIVNTAYTSYKIQLLDKQMKLVKETPFTSNKSFTFNYLNPGDYNIRVLIDKNENHQYDKGEITKLTQAEPIYIFPEAIVIRKNWEITDITLTF